MTPVPLLRIRNSPFSGAVRAPRCCRLESSAQGVQLVSPANGHRLEGVGRERTSWAASRATIRSIGRQKRKKKIDRIKKPLVARPCDRLSVNPARTEEWRGSFGGALEPARGGGTHHNPVFPSKVGEIQCLGDERVTSCDIAGNEDYDRKQPARGGSGQPGGGSSRGSNEQRPHQKLKSWKNLDLPDQLAMTDD